MTAALSFTYVVLPLIIDSLYLDIVVLLEIHSHIITSLTLLLKTIIVICMAKIAPVLVVHGGIKAAMSVP